MIRMKANDRTFEVDGQRLVNDVPPLNISDRTYVPVRFIAEHMGLNVDWDEQTEVVTIYGRKKYFDTADACAYDWGMHWNALSIAAFKELGGIIYKDDFGYYWDSVKAGREKEVYWSIPSVRKGVAFIHSHSGGKPALTDTMSKDDQTTAKACNRPLYMTDSGGRLYVYDPANGRAGQKKVAEGLPVDCKYTDMDAACMRDYFKGGYHDLKEYEFGYAADYYNKLYMAGKRYDEGAVAAIGTSAVMGDVNWIMVASA